MGFAYSFFFLLCYAIGYLCLQEKYNGSICIVFAVHSLCFFFLFIFLFALFFAVDSLFIWCSFSLDNVFYAFFFIFLFLWLLFEPLLGYVGNISGSLSRENIECFVFVVRRRITWLTVVLTKQGPVLWHPLIREVRTREN